MADRRQQLLEAFDKEEESDDTETLEDENLESSESDESVAKDDPPLVEDKSGSEEADEADGKEPARADAKELGKSDKKPKAGPDPSKSGRVAGAEGVQQKANTPKGTKKAPSAPTLEETERAAAEAGEAPKAWRPAVREHWNKIPPEAREEINRRETEITQFIGRHGAAIQHKAQFDELVNPFLPFIAAQQSTPMKAFHNLMTTAARLTTSSPQGKAQVISEIMRTYGIDAKTLDEVLSAQLQGNPLPAYQPTDLEPPAWAKPMLSFMQETKQARQEREQRTQQEAAEELSAFEKKPFFSDLREDIGFAMERASAKGQLMTLEQAYEKARKMNPEIDAILTQREKAAALKNGGGTPIEKARRAAATVRGAPGVGTAVKVNGAGKVEAPKDRRAQLLEAFDAASEE